MNTKSRARAAAAIGLIGALALTACGGTTPEDEAAEPIEAGSLEELIAAAEQEGQLVWYQTADQRIGDRLAEAFSEEYDISVSFNRLNSSQMEQRFSAEMEAGTPATDLILPIRSEFFDASMEAGWLVPLPDAGLPEYPPSALPEEAILDGIGSAVVNITPYAFAYNSDLVSEDEAPATWGDLLDPRWNGQMLMSDPTISTVYTQLYYLVEQEYGIEQLEQLGQMDTRIYQGAAPMLE
ncbi:MAG: ABC transporter substrate-binding protein, partial [Pseudoclavibacter sp.]